MPLGAPSTSSSIGSDAQITGKLSARFTTTGASSTATGDSTPSVHDTPRQRPLDPASLFIPVTILTLTASPTVSLTISLAVTATVTHDRSRSRSRSYHRP